jgi:hypothetical protein
VESYEAGFFDVKKEPVVEWNRVTVRIPSLNFDTCQCLHMRMTIDEGDLAEKMTLRFKMALRESDDVEVRNVRR